MTRPIATKIYDLYGRFYGLGEAFFRRRIGKALAGVAFHDGQRVLDVGVGTGLSLDFYPPSVHVTGVDLSPGMLTQARRKLQRGLVRRGCPADATKLMLGDALALPFEDHCFDVVLLSHVVTTVSDPVRCLTEAIRVTREGGTVVVVNHFRSPYQVINWLETAIDPICRRLGWRSDLGMVELLMPAGVGNLGHVQESPGMLFRILYLQKSRDGTRVICPAVAGKPNGKLEPV